MSDARNQILKLIYTQLISKKLRYVVLGDPFYKLREHGDIDIIVYTEDLAAVNACIQETIENNIDVTLLKRRIISSSKLKQYKFLIAQNPERNQLVQLDIFDCMHWKGLSFANFSSLETQITWADGIPVLKDMGQATLGAMKDKVFGREIKSVRYELGFSKENFLTQFSSSKISNIILKWFLNSENSFTVKIYFILWWVFNADIIRAKNMYMDYIRQMLRREDGVYLMAFYGPDGAGKSYIIDKLSAEPLISEYFGEIKFRHTMPRILPPLSTIRSLILKSNVSSEKRPARTIKPITRWHAILHCVYYSFDYLAEKIILYVSFIRPRKRTLLIYDRYFYEIAYQQTFKNMPVFLIYFLKYFSWGANLNIFLFARPDVIRSRKKELTESQIIDQVKRFKLIDEKYQLNSEFIDNSENSYSHVFDKICNAINKAQK